LHGLYRKRNVLKLAAIGDGSLGITGDEWDQDPMLFACKNGVIDLNTGEFRDGNSEDYIRTYSEVEWKGLNEPAPLWEQALRDIFNNDTDIIGLMKRLFGYAITGKSNEAILPILWGHGRNGKGTLCETLYYVLGDYAGVIQAESLMKPGRIKHGSEHSADIIDLSGKRFIYTSETAQDIGLNESKIKMLTGDDTIHARAPYERKGIDLKPNHTIFIQTNHKPPIKDRTDALWERVLLIEFPVQFIDTPDKSKKNNSKAKSKEKITKNPDKNLKEKLKKEASGILAWLVNGCVEWKRDGLCIPESVKNATVQYREDEDILSQFINARLVDDPNGSIKAGQLYSHYKLWCENSSSPYLSMKVFGSILSTLYERKDKGDGRYYMGISLKGKKVESSKEED